jgi:hypothetical protein
MVEEFGNDVTQLISSLSGTEYTVPTYLSEGERIPLMYHYFYITIVCLFGVQCRPLCTLMLIVAARSNSTGYMKI